MLLACRNWHGVEGLLKKVVKGHAWRMVLFKSSSAIPACHHHGRIAAYSLGTGSSSRHRQSSPQSSWHSAGDSSSNGRLPMLARGVSSSNSKYSSDLVRSVRAMPIKLVSVSKGNSAAATAMAQEWVAKLARYTSVSEVFVKPNPKGSAKPQVQKEAEAEKVLKAISPSDKVVILDERGREATSEEVARLLAEAGDHGTPLVFVVGGPFGHGAGVVERANDSIRLSRMVLNHQVAYVVLVEQLYRGWTIIRGEPYHH